MPAPALNKEDQDHNAFLNEFYKSMDQASDLLKEVRLLQADNSAIAKEVAPGLDEAIRDMTLKLAEAKKTGSLSQAYDNASSLSDSIAILEAMKNKIASGMEEEIIARDRLLVQDHSHLNLVSTAVNNALTAMVSSTAVSELSGGTRMISGLLSSAATAVSDVAEVVPAAHVNNMMLSLRFGIGFFMAITVLTVLVAYKDEVSDVITSGKNHLANAGCSVINGIKSGVSRLGIYGSTQQADSTEDLEADQVSLLHNNKK